MKGLTQKQEGFVVDYFQGVKPGQAYLTHYKVKTMATADACASRLLKYGKIQARLEELRKKVEDASVMNVLERKQRLSVIGRGSPTDFMTAGADGCYIDVGPENVHAGAVQEITSRTEYNEDGAGAAVVTKLKLHNPIQAISELNKMERIYEPDININIDNRKVEVHGLTDEQLESIAYRALSSGSRAIEEETSED